jgi:hypothetical protein
MKKLFYLPLLLSIFTFTSCEEENQPEIMECSIVDSWSMTNYSIGWGGSGEFEANQVIWTFNNENTLYISLDSSIWINPLIPFTTDGAQFNYIADSLLTIDEYSFNYEVSDSTLIIDDNPAADGILLVFTRN